jgi:hypothetical protein
MQVASTDSTANFALVLPLATFHLPPSYGQIPYLLETHQEPIFFAICVIRFILAIRDFS